MYTVKIYKTDRRTKQGERLVLKRDYNTDNLSMLEHTVRTTLQKGERYEIHQTYVKRTRAMDGREFEGRFSELYWSM